MEHPNILENGALRPMTDAECQCYQNDTGNTEAPEQTDVEKLKFRTAANEDAIAGIMDMLMGGMV